MCVTSHYDYERKEERSIRENLMEGKNKQREKYV